MKRESAEFNKSIFAHANNIAKAIEEETEEILEHAEEVVKQFVPARYVKATLDMLEKSLEEEGIEALFDKKVSREALRKTASEKVTASEVKEVVAEIVAAIVDEMEDVLKDADEVSDEFVAKSNDEYQFEVESKLKSTLEKKMASKGVYFRLERSKTSKK